MHTLRRQRSKEVVKNVYTLLEAMAFDSRLVGGLRHSEFMSTASSPSLRAPEGAFRDSMAGSDDAGNVKVVVRVRQFIPRGMFMQSSQCCVVLMSVNRDRCAVNMHHFDEPKATADDSRAAACRTRRDTEQESYEAR
jgi:hypothetical protein